MPALLVEGFNFTGQTRLDARREAVPGQRRARAYFVARALEESGPVVEGRHAEGPLSIRQELSVVFEA